jgi:HTH-type transcriptional regulator / antitoxin HigA
MSLLMLSMIRTIGKKTIGISETIFQPPTLKVNFYMLILDREKYIDLLNAFPPRPIKSRKDFSAIQKVVDALLDAKKLSSDQKEYLNLLGMIIHEYEERVVEIPDVYGVELLNALIEEWDLKQKDLVPIFKTESIVSAVLNGHRQLTVEHIQKLATFFGLSPAVFFPQPE